MRRTDGRHLPCRSSRSWRTPLHRSNDLCELTKEGSVRSSLRRRDALESWAQTACHGNNSFQPSQMNKQTQRIYCKRQSLRKTIHFNDKLLPKSATITQRRYFCKLTSYFRHQSQSGRCNPRSEALQFIYLFIWYHIHHIMVSNSSLHHIRQLIWKPGRSYHNHIVSSGFAMAPPSVTLGRIADDNYVCTNN